MENQINTDGKNNQIITENSVSGVSQKLKEPRIIIFVVLLVILSLGGIFAGIYHRQKQIITSSSSINDTIANWRTYGSIDNSLMFRYPAEWEAGKERVYGSRTVTEFKYKNTPLFELTLQGNYNQITGKPHDNLNEFLGPRLIKSKDIFIDGHAAKKIEDQGDPGHVIPYEEVIVFTPDNKAIVSLYYKSSYYDKPNANKILDQILLGFKFKTKYSDLSELKTADVLVQDGSYYGSPFDPDLYQLEIEQSHHLFAESDTINLKQYLGKRIKVSYREVKGVVMGEQQLVIVESVE